jgi:NTE family protein
MYTHLVISGGGIKGIAIIGTLKVLYDHKLLDKLEAYIGSSVGGLICLLLNIGYTYSELEDIMFNINFSEYRNINISAIFQNWGLDNGDSIVKLIIAIIKQKNISANITFKELYEKTGKLLVLTGSELIKNEAKYYNHINTPNMSVLDAIRVTISYPIIFNPVRNNVDEILIDGALFAPYPMDYFKDIDAKIGIIIHSRHNMNGIVDGEDYLINIIKCLTERYEKFHLKDYMNETIVLDIKDVHSMNFELTKDDKESMYQIGIDTAQKFLSNRKIDLISDNK